MTLCIKTAKGGLPSLVLELDSRNLVHVRRKGKKNGEHYAILVDLDSIQQKPRLIFLMQTMQTQYAS